MKKVIALFLATLLLLAVVVGCTKTPATTDTSSPGASDPVASDPGTSDPEASGSAETKTQENFVIANRREPKSLNPWASNDVASGFVTGLIYDGLVKFDANMQLQPALATSWEKVDDTHYRFTLRDDVYWHNGDKMTAQDVIDSFVAVAAAPASEGVMNMIDTEASSVLDETHIELVLTKPFAPFLNNLGLSIAAVTNVKAINAAGDAYDDQPVGTGPFKMVSWKRGDVMELTANENYWGGSINFKNLIIRLVPETATRVIEVETGGVDLAMAIGDNDAQNLSDNPEIQVIKQPILNTMFIGYNCSIEPYNDARVRQAIAYAVDPEIITRNLTFGQGTVADSFLAPDVFGYYGEGDRYPDNIEKAKQLLAEAGYPNGFTANIISDGDDVVCEMLQGMLAQIGITLEVTNVDFATWLDYTINGKQELYVGGWTVSSGDAAEGLAAFDSRLMGDGGNRMFYSNPQVDQLLDEGLAEQDPVKRAEIYKQIQIILMDEAVYIPLKVGQTIYAVRSGVENMITLPSQQIYFDQIRFK